jgi:hypothetical protein
LDFGVFKQAFLFFVELFDKFKQNRLLIKQGVIELYCALLDPTAIHSRVQIHGSEPVLHSGLENAMWPIVLIHVCAVNVGNEVSDEGLVGWEFGQV